VNIRTAAAVVATIAFAAGVTWGPGLVASWQEEARTAPAPPPSPPAPRPAPAVVPLDDGPSRTADGTPPNIVLLFGCTLRKDQTALYGGPDTMPWLGTLAAQGTTFDDALSVSSWTRASAVGVLTSRHPLALGLPEPGPKQSKRMLPARAETLAEVLRTAGYHTLGITANPNLNRQYGMAQGMVDYHDSDPDGFRRGRIRGEEQVQTILETLDAREDPDAPFYLQMMLIDAHHPREPDPAVVRRYQGPGVSSAMATYRASLTQLDDAFALLDRELAARGYDATNTLFVFVADHGEGMNDPAHHGPGHGKKMYPTTVAIPWVVRGPGVAAGQRVAGLASGVDVLPTVAGLIGATVPEEAVGHDLSAWVTGARTDLLRRERAFAYSMFHRADVGSVWTRTHQCQQYFEHDRDHQVTGCFDRRADPTFADPIAMPELREELVRWRAQRIAMAAGEEVTTTEIDDDVAEQLRLLGYADED
jgi:arylsulfatase A-like enzyme